MRASTARQRWGQLDGQRKGIVSRTEKYAGLTLPKFCLPDGFNNNHQEIGRDFQSVGAQAVNHLVNKLMLALFAPSRAFFRLDPTNELKAMLAELGIPEEKVKQALALGEKDAVAVLDRLALRPKLFEILKHLVIAGNVLMMLGDTMLVKGLKEFVVRRSMSGSVVEAMVAFKVMFDELELPAQEYLRELSRFKGTHAEDIEVTLYHWIVRAPSGDYVVTQWVDDDQLPADPYTGNYVEKDLPYHFLTWDLADGQHYGTGLVEDYSGDLSALSMMSRSLVIGALMSSEYRWLVNPAGMTNVLDFQNSENGDAIPGKEGDVSMIQSEKSGDLQTVNAISQEYIRRIGAGFLMVGAMTRDAERVTAEEIRMQANELETGLGGGYSRIAVSAQIPLSTWLLQKIGFNIEGNQVEPTIVTGLEALSRAGDLEDLKLTLSDAAMVTQLPEAMQDRLKMDAIFSEIGAGRRVDTTRFIMDDQEYSQKLAQRQEQQMQMEAQTTGIQAGADIAVNNQTQGA